MTNRSDGWYRLRVTPRWVVLILLGVLLSARAQADEESEALWIQRTSGENFLWAKIHPSGFTWVQLKTSPGKKIDGYQLFGTLEFALSLDPDDYGALRTVANELKLRPGMWGSTRAIQVGMGARPEQATHTALDAPTQRLADLFEQRLERAVGTFRESWEQARRDAARCRFGLHTVTATAHTSQHRTVHGDMQTDEESGPRCLHRQAARALLFKRKTHMQVWLTFKADGEPLRISYDDRVPLLLGNEQLEIGAGLQRIAHEERHIVELAGSWPTESQAYVHPIGVTEGVEFEIGRQPLMHFPRGLWNAEIDLQLSLSRAGKQVVKSRITFRDNALVRCEGLGMIGHCRVHRLEPSEIRALAAAAFAQCRSLKAEQPVAQDTQTSTSIRVKVGQDRCEVSLVRRCLPFDYTDARTNRQGLRALFRLSFRAKPWQEPFDTCMAKQASE
jgi:hypothetical protein